MVCSPYIFFTFLFKFSSDPNTESTGGFCYTSIDGLGSGPKLGWLLWICVFLFFWERVRPCPPLVHKANLKALNAATEHLLLSFFDVDGSHLVPHKYIREQNALRNISVQYGICE